MLHCHIGGWGATDPDAGQAPHGRPGRAIPAGPGRAAAQVGQHEDGRETYGHSLVVDPWGKVLLDMGGEGPGLAFCDIDLSRVAEVRAQVPSLANRREIPN